MELNNRPKAMISDFGTSEEMLRGKRERTGHTGTMEYMVRPAHSPLSGLKSHRYRLRRLSLPTSAGNGDHPIVMLTCGHLVCSSIVPHDSS